MTALSAACEYLESAGRSPLPAAVEEAAIAHVLDTFAAMISGAGLLPGKRGAAVAAALGGEPVATVLATGKKAGPFAAALANGMAAHADETDDSHAPSLSHPGCSIVPAAFAAGEAVGCCGATFLRAVAAGYDIGCRIGRALGREAVDLNRSTRSSHALVGTFGSAAAAGVVHGMSRREFSALLSYASQQAAGVTSWQRDTEHIEKAFVFGGMPASSGVLAATMVSSGCTGVDDAFAGHPSALLALSGSADEPLIAAGLGSQFELLATNIKRYAVGSPAQAAVQACEELLAEGLAPGQITGLELHLPADLARVVDGRRMPDVNVQYLMAGTLLDGRFTFAMAHDTPRMAAAPVRALMDRTVLVPEQRLSGARGAELTARTADGAEWRRVVGTVHGTAGNPMTLQEVVAKARDLITPALGAEAGERLIAALTGLGHAPGLASLAPAR